MNAKYHFDVLPYHPEPKYMESQTSWLLRLINGNGIRNLADLFRVFTTNEDARKLAVSFREYPDFPSRVTAKLAVIANLPENSIKLTTFHHIGLKFGRYSSEESLAPFLKKSVSRHLRYCPLCLAGQHYYDLKWQFLHIIGCPIHRCYLLDSCPNCHSNILPLEGKECHQLGTCPFCSSDMSLLPVVTMEGELCPRVEEQYRELEKLLQPEVWEGLPHILPRVAQYLRYIREAKQISPVRLSQCSRLSTNVINHIEQGHFQILGFASILRHSQSLDTSLLEAFSFAASTEQLESTKRTLWSEDVWEEKLVRAIEKLTRNGTPPVRSAVAEELSISIPTLHRYLVKFKGLTKFRARYYLHNDSQSD